MLPKNREIQRRDDKVLGIIWSVDVDELVIDIKSYVNRCEELIPTKRTILKVIAGIYDPKGFIQLLTVKLKIIFQYVCSLGTDWDVEPGERLRIQWGKIIDSFRKMNGVIIPCCYCINKITNPIARVELHGFSYVSESAFGACIYLRFIKASRKVKVTLIMSKSQIALRKPQHTIPKLQLLGIYLLSKFVVNVKRALQDQICINRTYCCSDSKVSLVWINAKQKEFKTFVPTRLIEI